MSTLKFGPPLNFQKWIDEHRHQLKPPVGNAQVWETGDFMITVVGGPNVRVDYHVDPYDEFFYQLKGDMNLRLWVDGKPQDMPIREGEIFMLPAFQPHSPQRPDPESIGLVIEAKRPAGVLDAFQWYCDNCGNIVHRVDVQLLDIVADLPKIYQAFSDSEEMRTCKHCGTVHTGKPKS